MAVNFSVLMLLPNYDMWARPITVIPLASQPGAPAYTARGIYDTRAMDVSAMDGSIFSDQQTILDIRQSEFYVLPEQLDRIYIPADADGGAELGTFEVVGSEDDGGGETTLILRKLLDAKPQ